MTVPPKPARFHPEDPPPGFEKKLISFWQDRPRIKPRLQLVHTNGASREGSVESSYNWANQPGSGHTIPHCQIDRSGRAALILPADRKGIANYKAADFSLAFETADTGYLADPTISAFTDKQAESVAVACAYYAWGFGIPLAYPETWDGSGTASHTEPFGYPLWTNSQGKICPGVKKKRQVRDIILPRARQILAAWTEPTPPPPPPPPPPGEDPDVITYNEIKGITSVPSVADVTAGKADRWLNAALLKALLFDVTGSDEYDQAAALKLDAAVKRVDAT